MTIHCIFGCTKQSMPTVRTIPQPAGQQKDNVRFATFNVSMHGKEPGEVLERLITEEDPQFQKIAEIIQRVRPDVLLLNEFDYDAELKGISWFAKKLPGKIAKRPTANQVSVCLHEFRQHGRGLGIGPEWRRKERNAE